MAVFLETPANISPATTGSWQTVNLDSYIAGLPSNTSGVMLKFIGGTSTTMGARKHGSTDNRTSYNYYAGMSFYIGCDNLRRINVFRQNTNVTVYVVGYFTDDARFFTNGVNKSPSTTSAWTDIDCSSVVPKDAIAAIFDVKNAGTFGFRKKGSTNGRTAGTAAHNGVIVGLDANKICQMYTTVGADTAYLVGYITKGVFLNNSVDVSIGTTGAYTDIDVSGHANAANAVGLVIEVYSSLDRNYGLRSNGATYDHYMKHQYHDWGAVGLDSNKIFEGKIDSTTVDFHVIGYLHAETPASTSRRPTNRRKYTNQR